MKQKGATVILLVNCISLLVILQGQRSIKIFVLF